MSTTVANHTFTAYWSHDAIETNTGFQDFSPLVLSYTTRHNYTADRGVAEVVCSSYPSGFRENDHVVLTVDGTTVFNGRLARPAVRFYDTWTFYCEDVAANLSFPWGGEGTDPELDALFNRVYQSQTDTAIITNLCEAMAVPVSLHSITGASKVLGTVYDVVLRVGQNAWSLIREIDMFLGYWTASRNNGTIYRLPLAVGSADFTAVEGTNIISGERQPLGTESIVNRYIVYGWDSEFGTVGGPGVGDYSLPNSNIPTPPTSHSDTVRSNLIEDNAQALATATLLVGLHNFPYDETNLVLLGDPTINIGQTVAITSADLDHAGDLRFVAEVSHRFGLGVGFETSIKCIRTE